MSQSKNSTTSSPVAPPTTTTPLAPEIVATAQPCSTLALDKDGILLQDVPSQASAVLVPISASHTGFTLPSPSMVPPVMTILSSIVTAHALCLGLVRLVSTLQACSVGL